MDSNVGEVSVIKTGKKISVSIKFNPYKDSLELILGIPFPTMTAYYIPVFSYNTGRLINGGVWIGYDGKLSYYGDTSTIIHLTHFEYIAA